MVAPTPLAVETAPTMPELPEVETTRAGIAPHITGKTIQQIIIRQAQLRWPIPASLTKTLPGQTILSVNRRAKYLLLHTAQGHILMHLGMSGSLRIYAHDATPAAQKHDHVDLVFTDGTVLRFHDPRRFGAILWHPGAPEHHPLLAHLGPEPFSDEFNAGYLKASLHKQSRAIKLALMDNHVVVGVGNIYANESLFYAGIRPTKAAQRLTKAETIRLVEAVKSVLQRAILAGGSTLRDFVNSNGQSGYFQQQYMVYGRSGETCRVCGSLIMKITQGQRSSFYCPHCQH